MHVINANECGLIRLGYQSENDRTKVIFDVSDLAEEFPGGLITVAVRRPQETESHLITSVTQTGAVAEWLVDDYELEKKGMGELQLIYTIPDVVAKTKIWETSISRSLTVTSAVPPDWHDIANQLLEAAGAVHQVVEHVQTLHDETEGYRDETLPVKNEAEQIRDDTQALHDETETFRDQASTFATRAEDAKNQTENLYDATEALTAQVSADAAKVSADKTDVQRLRDETKDFRDEASDFADKAEQQAADAGYMEVEIVNGHLIYRRTKNVHIDLALRDGHLYMEVV